MARAKKQSKRLRITKLTPGEEYRFGTWWAHACMHGYSNTRAAEYAWRRIKEEYPRLRKYDAAE